MTKKWGDNSRIIHMFQKRGNDPRKIMMLTDSIFEKLEKLVMSNKNCG